MTTDSLDVEEFIVGYLAEVDDHLKASRACLVALDASLQKGGANPKAVRELFRALHTIKGLSAMVGAEPIVDIAHELETLLRSADRSGGRLPAQAVDQIVRALKAIEERVGNLSRKETLPVAPKELLTALAALQLDAGPALKSGTLSLEAELLAKLSLAEQAQLLQGLAQGKRAIRADFMPSQERAARGLSITSVRAQIASLGELVKVLPRSVPATATTPAAVAFILLVVTDAGNDELARVVDVAPDQIQELIAVSVEPALAALDDDGLDRSDDQGQGRNVVRVEVQRLDDALEVLSALMVTRLRLQRSVAAVSQGQVQFRELNAILGENARQLRDLRAALMRARMVSVAEMLERTPLLIRGLSRSSGKPVQLHLDAGRSELDKSVADRLAPAIVHLLRNAVDHAIELPDERKANGKPAEGRIDITCVASSGSHLTLVVADDGRGIDAVKVARRAGKPVPPDDAGLLALITRPGLSTLDKATHTSGRGLGMDIVKRIVCDDLGGQLELRTEPGRGTRFMLTVPLSVTILDAFSFLSATRTFVVPVSSVDDLVEIAPTAVSGPPMLTGRGSPARLLQYRGQSVPLFKLGALLGFSGAAATQPIAIIVAKSDKRFAFEVDKMLNQQEIVVRPLKDALVTVDGISGSTDLGDGQPTLVLDLLALVERASTSGAAS